MAVKRGRKLETIEARKVSQMAADSEPGNHLTQGLKDQLRYLWKCIGREPPKSLKEYQERAYEYMEVTLACDCTLDKPGLALALGYANTESMFNAESLQGESALAFVHKSTVSLMERLCTELATKGKIGAIFLLKASYGYSDQPRNASIALPALTINLAIAAPTPHVGGSFGGVSVIAPQLIPIESNT